jgi:hypothetical protein
VQEDLVRLMSVDRRRAGFRLPWTAEGEETDGEHAAADAEVDEMPPSDTPTQPAADGSATNDSAIDVTAVAAPHDTAASDAPAPSTASEGESTDFLRDLVGAMRGVAETSRDASLAELRTAIDARLEALGIQASERESDLRRRAELDLESVADWERTEIERVRSESEHKRETRRAQLEQQLSEHRSASERDAEATRSRLSEHERDLAAFFAQLAEITDPAAFVAAAKRMPRAPEMTSASAPAAPAADDPRLAAMGMSSEAHAATTDSPTSPNTEPATGPGEPAAAVAAPAEAARAADATPEPAAEAGSGTENQAENPDSRLAERLAQLDERLSGATQPIAAAAPATANGNGGEASTAIVVKGLGSFGAITSFKQALERVEGVRGVTLSLGPTGEFVYRASHAEDFDLVAAIQGIEGPTATIEDTDGTLVVTLSRAR